jgi:hypothetical protein
VEKKKTAAAAGRIAGLGPYVEGAGFLVLGGTAIALAAPFAPGVAADLFLGAGEVEGTIALGLQSSSAGVRVVAATTLIGLEYVGLNPQGFAPSGSAGAMRAPPKPRPTPKTVTRLAVVPDTSNTKQPAKVHGKAQVTSPGHAEDIEEKTNEAKMYPDVTDVYRSTSLRTITGDKSAPNRLPDIVIKSTDNKLDLMERASPSDKLVGSSPASRDSWLVNRLLKSLLALDKQGGSATIFGMNFNQFRRFVRSINKNVKR